MKYSTTDFLKAAAHTAEHFGFRTVDTLKKDPACRGCENQLDHSIAETDHSLDDHGALPIADTVAFCQEKLHALASPVLLYALRTQPEKNEATLTLNIFNVQKSIAEAILIQAGRSLLNELGTSDHLVRINSLGDTESSTRYTKELTTFLRKRIDHMSDEARELMKTHPYLALRQLLTEGHELAYKSPSPLEFLSDPSRKHFREIIEYLDISEAPYEIDPKMLAHHEFYSDALFSIEPQTNTTDTDSVSMRGGRFGEYLYRRTKKRIPAVSTVITLKHSKPVLRVPRFKAPLSSVYVVQLGVGPKMRSLMVIEELKRAGIPVEHDLASDSLSAQLREAERKGVRYTVIIGQKEYVEQTVILRDLQERSQEQVPVEQMIRKLKRQNAPLRTP